MEEKENMEQVVNESVTNNEEVEIKNSKHGKKDKKNKEVEKLQEENNTTVISIAHRLSTLKNCNKIIVLNKGHIEESGKYDELIENNGMFSDMYYGKLK